MRDQGIEQPAGHSQQPGQQHDSSLKDVDLHSRLLQRLAECTSTVQQAANSLGQQQLPDTVVANTQPQPQQQDPKQQHAARQQHPQPQLQEQQRLLTEQLQREQLEKQQQLADLQQRLQHELHKLQQRAQQLEIENAALRDAQAQADVLRSKVERMHQAEQLKQVSVVVDLLPAAAPAVATPAVGGLSFVKRAVSRLWLYCSGLASD